MVDGQILAVSGVEPPDFLFDKLSVGETKSAQVYVMAMLQDELTVKDPQISDPTIRDKFDVKIEPVEPKRTCRTSMAKRGYRVIGHGERWPAGRTVSFVGDIAHESTRRGEARDSDRWPGRGRHQRCAV